MYQIHPKSCRCCTWSSPPIPPDGPQPCRVLFIGEGPAKWEVKKNRPFMGNAGTEFNYQYLPLCGLCRDDVRTTNATLCPLPNYRNPTNEEAAVCAAKHLPLELLVTRPEVVIPMGAVACSLFPGINLELDHGIPRDGSYGDWEGTIFPTYHPAAGIHSPDFYMPLLRSDFERLGLYLKGRLPVPQDAYPEPQYELADPEMVSLILDFDEPPLIAIDTETDMETHQPWCLSFSTRPGTGWVIKADDSQSIAILQSYLSSHHPLTIFHHSVHDLPVLSQMGLQVTRFTDTMMDAFHLGLQQSLKVLAWRLCGMRMTEYEDVVLPASRPTAITYLEACRSTLESKFMTPAKTTLSKITFKPQSGTPKSTSLLYRKVCKLIADSTASPWDRWDNWHDHDRDLLTTLMNRPIPRPSIAHVPLDRAVVYSGMDSDATIRVHHALQALKIKSRIRV